MPVDTSIYSNIQQPQAPNPLDVAIKGMTMKSLALQNQTTERNLQDQNAMRDAYKNNMTIGPDGTPQFNQSAIMSSLAGKLNNPMAALENASQVAKTQADLSDAKQKQQEDMRKGAAARLSAIPTDPSTPLADKQAAWTQMHVNSVRQGIPGADTMPLQYPGDDYVNQMKFRVLPTETQADLQEKQKNYALQQQEFALKKFQALGGPPPGGSVPANTQGQGGAKPSGGGDVDPATLVKFQVPAAHQQKVFDEIDAAQKTVQNGPQILKAFDDAANNIHAADFVPGVPNVDQKALHALLGPTFKDVEGTVRQAAMDNMFANITPQFGDDKNTKTTKRAALVDYLKSKSSVAPTSKGFGLDLTKYKSTNFNPSVNMRAPDGSVHAVPMDQVDAAKAAGGKQI